MSLNALLLLPSYSASNFLRCERICEARCERPFLRSSNRSLNRRFASVVNSLVSNDRNIIRLCKKFSQSVEEKL